MVEKRDTIDLASVERELQIAKLLDIYIENMDWDNGILQATTATIANSKFLGKFGSFPENKAFRGK